MKNNDRLLAYDSNTSRRELLRLLGMTGAGLMLGSLVGCQNNGKKAPPVPTDLKFYGTGTLNLEKWDQLKKDLSIGMTFKDNGNEIGPIVSQMITGTAASDFDIAGLQGGAERELAAAGAILPWDTGQLHHWADVWDFAKAIPHIHYNDQLYGLPIVLNADSMIYLPEKVGTIDSYAAVFDPKLKGKTSMEDSWINSTIFTAIYLKQNSLAKIDNPGDLTESELGEVMEFLIKKKKEGQFVKLWSGWEDGLELIKSQKAWVMTGWEPIVYAAQKAGINAKYAIPKEGYEGWSNNLVLCKGAKDRNSLELAHKFADWELGGYYGCAIADLRGYVVPTDASTAYAKSHATEFDAAKIEKIAQNVKDKFFKMKGITFWQNMRPKNYKQYEVWWSKLRSA